MRYTLRIFVLLRNLLLSVLLVCVFLINHSHATSYPLELIAYECELKLKAWNTTGGISGDSSIPSYFNIAHGQGSVSVANPQMEGHIYVR